MVTAARRLQRLQRVRRLRARARERGATLFVVVLVMTLLLGIGAYAARSAQLATAASGSERQMVQARYVAEYGLMFATAKLSNPAAQSFLTTMAHPTTSTVCYGQNPSPGVMPSRSCYQVLAADITQELTTSYNVCDPVIGGNPGSLGMSNTECDFRVELSDLSDGPVVPGNTKNALRFWYVTGTSTGQVRIVNTGGTVLDAKSAESTQTQTLRSRILVGPISIQN